MGSSRPEKGGHDHVKLSILSLRINMHLLRLFALNTCIMHQIAYYRNRSCRPSFQDFQCCETLPRAATLMHLTCPIVRGLTRKASHFRELAQNVFTFTPLLWSWLDKVFNSGLTLLPTQPLLFSSHSPQPIPPLAIFTRDPQGQERTLFLL